MTTANNSNSNLSLWQPGQSGDPGGRPKGTRGLCPSKTYWGQNGHKRKPRFSNVGFHLWGATGGRLIRFKSRAEPTT